MRRDVLTLCCVVLAAGAISGCGSTYAERREMLDAEWAVTNARADEIHAEYVRRMERAETSAERDAVVRWRADELSKNFDDHYRRTGALSEQWRDED
jgi:hypothetical protein